MKNIAIIDAGPMIALFDCSDKYHHRIIDFLKEYSGKLITTLPIITEVTHLLDFNINAQLDFLRWVDTGAVSLFPITQKHLKEMIILIDKYQDIPMDFADGSLVILAKELELNKVISLDADFSIYRYNIKKHFCNLLNV